MWVIRHRDYKHMFLRPVSKWGDEYPRQELPDFVWPGKEDGYDNRFYMQNYFTPILEHAWQYPRAELPWTEAVPGLKRDYVYDSLADTEEIIEWFAAYVLAMKPKEAS